MADASVNFAIRILPTANPLPGGWVPIVTPIDCSRIVLRNGDGTNVARLRTDPTDPTTEDSIPASSEFTIQITAVNTYVKSGTTIVFFVPPVSGGLVTGKFYR